MQLYWFSHLLHPARETELVCSWILVSRTGYHCSKARYSTVKSGAKMSQICRKVHETCISNAIYCMSASKMIIVSQLLFSSNVSISSLYRAIGLWNISRRTRGTKTWNEKALRETQTLRAGCSKADPKIFAQPQTPFPGVQDGQNLTTWRRSLPLPTNPVCTQFRVIMYTDPQTHKPTDRTDYNTLCFWA